MEVFQNQGRWLIRHKISRKLFRSSYSQRVAAEFLAKTYLQLWQRRLAGEEADLHTNFVNDLSEVKA